MKNNLKNLILFVSLAFVCTFDCCGEYGPQAGAQIDNPANQLLAKVHLAIDACIQFDAPAILAFDSGRLMEIVQAIRAAIPRDLTNERFGVEQIENILDISKEVREIADGASYVALELQRVCHTGHVYINLFAYNCVQLSEALVELAGVLACSLAGEDPSSR